MENQTRNMVGEEKSATQKRVISLKSRDAFAGAVALGSFVTMYEIGKKMYPMVSEKIESFIKSFIDK